MKSTYKLIGLFLDHISFPTDQPCFVPAPNDDAPKINLSTLLSLSDKDASEFKVATENIQIVVDYFPIASNDIVEAFYTKRVLQIVEKLHSMGTRCYFSSGEVNADKFAKFERTIVNIYKNKAHNTVGAAL